MTFKMKVRLRLWNLRTKAATRWLLTAKRLPNSRLWIHKSLSKSSLLLRKLAKVLEMENLIRIVRQKSSIASVRDMNYEGKLVCHCHRDLTLRSTWSWTSFQSSSQTNACTWRSHSSCFTTGSMQLFLATRTPQTGSCMTSLLHLRANLSKSLLKSCSRSKRRSVRRAEKNLKCSSWRLSSLLRESVSIQRWNNLQLRLLNLHRLSHMVKCKDLLVPSSSNLELTIYSF